MKPPRPSVSTKGAGTPAPARESNAPVALKIAPDPASPRYTTGEMARLSNNTLRTVRFYEEAGILQPIGRTEGGHRVFEASQLERLMWISDMREAGLSLEQIRVLLETKARARSGGEAAKGAAAALRGHIDELHQKMTVLARLSADLERTLDIANGCLTCEDDQLFPRQCGECGRMRARGPIPRGTRVLWDIAGEDASATIEDTSKG
jgi:DNA-binding transcriptional MerR regulator